MAFAQPDDVFDHIVKCERALNTGLTVNSPSNLPLWSPDDCRL